MYKSFKYRIYPNEEQKLKIDRTIGVCRLVYNLGLEVKITAYKSAGIILSIYEIKKQLPELRRAYQWISEVDSQALQNSILNIDRAFKNFFKGAGYPNFKRKSTGGSFQCPSGVRRIDWLNSTITIPKIKKIPIVLSRSFDGEIRIITIKKTSSGKYFASILVKCKKNFPTLPDSKSGIGVDLGITSFASLSTGEKINNPRFLKSELKRLKLLQRRASRKKKGGKNRGKAVLKISLLHEKITNQRNDFLHKVSTQLICDNQTDTICVETLAVKNMVKNHSIAQSINDVSWGEFIRQLEYKGKWYGKNIIKINKWLATSKTCSKCNHKLDELALSVREWTCPKCGDHHDRDINAAINIRNSGMGSPGEPMELSTLVGAVK